jgi:hypothetical protein
MSEIQECPVCGVKIENDTKVLFSYGRPGTRGRLQARVCQFLKEDEKKEKCINQGHPLSEVIINSDYYN